MELEQITTTIFHIKFKTSEQAAKTFLRFQEYYESPKFRGKVFSLREFKRWYTANTGRIAGKREFTYHTDWQGGFNIPSHILEPFYNGQFNPLSRREKALLRLLPPWRHKKFYLIGTSGKCTPELLRHEIAHGLFYLNAGYRREVLKILGRVGKKIKRQLDLYFSKTRGYHSAVWTDEMHAYIMTDLNEFGQYGIDIAKISAVSRELNAVFDSHFKRK